MKKSSIFVMMLLPGISTAALSAPLLTTLAAAESSAQRDLTVEQTTAANAGLTRPGGLKVSVSSDHPDGIYSIGEIARLFIMSSEDAFVTVLNVGPSGEVTQLFPNQYQPDNHVPGGRAVEIAGGSSGGHVAISGPVGNELIKVIASDKPLTVISEAQLQGNGIFRSVQGGVQTLTRNLEIVSKPAEGGADHRIVMENFTLHTIASRLPSTTQPVVVTTSPLAQPAVVASGTVLLPVISPQSSPLTLPAAHAFPLLLAVDKPVYKVGESVTLAVTSLQACYLTVLDVTPNGRVRMLFPNRVTPNNAVAALQTVLVSGSPSPVTLVAAAPAGTEQVMALCSTDANPIVTPSTLQGTDLFPSAGERADVARNLSIAANRPVESLSTASLSFGILP